MIGLGGAEFRLPVLVGLLKRQAREAIAINLAVSLVTLIAALFTRLQTSQPFPILDLLPILIAMAAGAMLAAFVAAGIAAKIPLHVLERLIKVLLFSIGGLLIIESFLPEISFNLQEGHLLVNIAVALIAGLLIGVVSSTLGVAGGELIIPTLIFIFGLGVKVAGTASVMISLPTVSIGLLRYFQLGALFERPALRQIVIPMALGSVLGSILGGMLLGLVSANLLKLILGVVLMVSALQIFKKPANLKPQTG